MEYGGCNSIYIELSNFFQGLFFILFKNSKLDLKSEAKQLKKEGESIRAIADILKKKYGANAPKKSTIGDWVKG